MGVSDPTCVELASLLKFAKAMQIYFWGWSLTDSAVSSRYNSMMKVIFLASSFTIIYYMRIHRSVRQTYDKEQDSFRVAFILGPSALLALLINQEFSAMEVGKPQLPVSALPDCRHGPHIE